MQEFNIKFILNQFVFFTLDVLNGLDEKNQSCFLCRNPYSGF
jgi:hypothetical protein